MKKALIRTATSIGATCLAVISVTPASTASTSVSTPEYVAATNAMFDQMEGGYGQFGQQPSIAYTVTDNSKRAKHKTDDAPKGYVYVEPHQVTTVVNPDGSFASYIFRAKSYGGDGWYSDQQAFLLCPNGSAGVCYERNRSARPGPWKKTRYTGEPVTIANMWSRARAAALSLPQSVSRGLVGDASVAADMTPLDLSGQLNFKATGAIQSAPAIATQIISYQDNYIGFRNDYSANTGQPSSINYSLQPKPWTPVTAPKVKRS